MGDLDEPDLENTRNIVPKHIGHKHVGVIAVSGAETVGNVLDHVQVTLKKFKSRIERVDFELFLFFPCGLPE
jgi:hypothetical protein